MAYTITSYDTSPIISITCKNEDGSARNITGASATIQLCSVFSPTTIVYSFTGTISTGTDGVVTYTLQTGDIEAKGEYFAKCKIVFSGGAIEHFPQGKYGERIDVIDLPS